MRIYALLLYICACGAPSFAFGQATTTCMTCLRAEACDSKRTVCTAECRARMFTVDPRRAECLTKCSNTTAQCAQAALNFCQQLNAC